MTRLAQHAGLARLVYNFGLNLFWHSLALPASDSFRIQSIKKCFTNVVKKRAEYAPMNQLSSIVYQCAKSARRKAPTAFQDLQSAFYRWRKCLAQKQVYKRRKHKQSFTVCDSNGKVLVKAGKTIKIPTLGTLRLQEPLTEGYVTQTFTLSCEAGKWFVYFSVDAEKIPPLQHQVAVTAGTDLGVKQFATLSDGTEIKAPKPLKKAQALLRKFQYRNRNKQLRLERTAQGTCGNRKTGQRASNNAKKYFKRRLRLHGKIASQRRDFLNKTATDLCRKYAGSRIEDLNVKGMIANRKLALAIRDLGFYEFRRQMEYKAPAFGCQLEIADRWYPSSKQCRMCQHVNGELQLKDRVFSCPSCGHTEARDLDAAINLAQAPSSRCSRGGWPRTDACGQVAGVCFG